MIEKIESLIKRIRWKAHFFDGNNTENSDISNFNLQINETDFELVSADKTTNMYKMSEQDYNKL